jgi:tetratricopeptide (TPR) repeat protein
MDAANEARAKGDKVATANALRFALELDPENAELLNAHKEAQNAADALLVDQYLKQAAYEEKAERWAEAGRSWTRVTRTKTTDGKAHERAAFCILKASGDLHEAATLGQRAVQLEPKNVEFRRTLASIYLAANLTLNAKRELEIAVQLAPDDAQTTSVLKRILKSK